MLTKEPATEPANSVPWLSLERYGQGSYTESKRNKIYFDFLNSEDRIKLAEKAMSGSCEVLDHLGGSGKDSQWGNGYGLHLIGEHKDMVKYVQEKQKIKLGKILDSLPIWC